jgi:hypothetical protein
MRKKQFEHLKQSLREASLIKRGLLKPARVFHVEKVAHTGRFRRKLT